MLTPENIKRQVFKKSLKGFDPDEVQAFIGKLADEIDGLQKENTVLKRNLEQITLQLTEYKRMEKNIQDTLAKAQETSARTIESARKQTNLMIQEAELKARQLLDKARENANEVRNAVIQLREEKQMIVSKLKAVINSQAHLFEMKVENADKETEPVKTVERSSKINIDADNIADKL